MPVHRSRQTDSSVCSYLYYTTFFIFCAVLPYVFSQAKPDLNRTYLSEELQKLGISEFEAQMLSLSQKAFLPDWDRATLSECEAALLHGMLFGRTYGTIEQYWKNQVMKSKPEASSLSFGVKLRYFYRRLYPSREHMEKWCELYAPFFYRHSRLMPAARLWRFLRADKEKRRIVQKEFKTVRKM